MRLEVPSLPAMKEARDFQQLWRNLNNDQVHVCEMLFERISGNRVFLPHDPPQELWAPFREMIDAIEKTVQAFDYVFSVLEVDPEDRDSLPEALFAVERWLHGNRDFTSDETLLSVFEAIFVDVKISLAFGFPSTDHALDAVFHLPFEPREVQVTRPPPSDFFISYKHARYFDLASQLSELLQERGFSCWLDREQLGLQEGERIDSFLLKQKLKAALQAARCTAFFETLGTASANEDFRGETTIFNWQVFEHRYANDVVYIRPQRGILELGLELGPTRALPYRSPADLADKLATYLGRPGSPDDPPPESLRRRPALPPLDETAGSLRELAAEYFGRPIEISPRAALCLLAPGEAFNDYDELVTTPADILIHLLRHSPRCALLLAGAGLELKRLFAVGVKLNNAPWSPPSDLVFEDVFGGHVGGRSSEASRVAETGLLDEMSLLAALLEVASSTGSYARELLVRLFRWVDLRLDERSALEAVRRLWMKTSEALRRRKLLFHDQQWAIHPIPEGWAVRPIAAAGLYQVADLEESGPTLIRVHAFQKGGIFPPEGFDDFQDLLSKEPSPEDVETFLSKSPELAFALGDPKVAYLTTIYEIPKGHFPMEQFFLERVDLLPSPEIDRSAANGESFSSRLLAALNALKGMAAARDGALEKAWQDKRGFPLASLRPRTALVLGRPMEIPGATPGETAESVSLFDLHTSVLAPLWEYQQIRDLDYDSF